jgi:hypothetical protein
MKPDRSAPVRSPSLSEDVSLDRTNYQAANIDRSNRWPVCGSVVRGLHRTISRIKKV